jgi:hypothetical protein
MNETRDSRELEPYMTDSAALQEDYLREALHKLLDLPYERDYPFISSLEWSLSTALLQGRKKTPNERNKRLLTRAKEKRQRVDE